ncbi:MAG: hypothetical protein KDA93_23035 [Planctomycetaceae bacterium]|nr:hypothetical protein [Planctomycetaceae bacterium]
MDQRDQIDEFASMFRKAERETYVFADVPLESVAIVTDQPAGQADNVREQLAVFLPRLQSIDTWHVNAAGDFDNVQELISRFEAQQPDLVITYRHLFEESHVPQHSLGVYLDVLTQVLQPPVLVLPGTAIAPQPLDTTPGRCVMVVTDRISGDDRLINYGAGMTPDGGEMWLCHVEDDAVFERYMAAIERIPEIDTDQARKLIDQQLLKEAGDYINTCLTELRDKRPSVTFHSSIARGHQLKQYQQLVESHNVDLLLINTNDEHQLAMHGMAYALSVELIDRMLLLL